MISTYMRRVSSHLERRLHHTPIPRRTRVDPTLGHCWEVWWFEDYSPFVRPSNQPSLAIDGNYPSPQLAEDAVRSMCFLTPLAARKFCIVEVNK